MTYTTWSTTSDTITAAELDKLTAFIIQEIANSTEPAAANMGLNPPAGFLYNIKNQLRWQADAGAVYVIEHDDQIVAVSGVEYAEGATSWAVGGIRTWITPTHRTYQLPGKLLHQQTAWAQAHNCNFMLVTFNDYNRALHTAVQRGIYSKSLGWSTWWDDCIAVPDPVVIRYTEQWCVIKPVLEQDNSVNLIELAAWAIGANK